MSDTSGTEWTQLKSTARHGTAVKGQASDGTGASGNFASFDADGSLTDSGVTTAGSGFKPYHLVCQFLGNAPIPANSVAIWTCTSDLPSGVTFAGNFADSAGRCLTNPTATAVFTINKIPSGSSTPTAFGTVTISTSGVFTFATTAGASESFAAGDSLTAVAPGTPDTTLANVEFTLAGTR